MCTGAGEPTELAEVRQLVHAAKWFATMIEPATPEGRQRRHGGMLAQWLARARMSATIWVFESA
jgi:hypothetical protein